MIYFCTFGGGEDFGGRDRTRFNLELGSSERGSCSVPMASNFLKEEPSGQGLSSLSYCYFIHQAMLFGRLSLLISILMHFTYGF